MYDLYIAHNDYTFENNFELKKASLLLSFLDEKCIEKSAIFVNIFFHKMTYNIFTGYLSIGKWYSINAELSDLSISVFKVKICLEFGEILWPKGRWLIMPVVLGFLKGQT